MTENEIYAVMIKMFLKEFILIETVGDGVWAGICDTLYKIPDEENCFNIEFEDGRTAGIFVKKVNPDCVEGEVDPTNPRSRIVSLVVPRKLSGHDIEFKYWPKLHMWSSVVKGRVALVSPPKAGKSKCDVFVPGRGTGTLVEAEFKDAFKLASEYLLEK